MATKMLNERNKKIICQNNLVLLHCQPWKTKKSNMHNHIRKLRKQAFPTKGGEGYFYG